MGGGDDDDDSSGSGDHGDDDDVEDEGEDSTKRCKDDAELKPDSRKRRRISKNVGGDCRDSENDCVQECVDNSKAPKIATRASARRKMVITVKQTADEDPIMSDDECGDAEVHDECGEVEVKVVGTMDSGVGVQDEEGRQEKVEAEDKVVNVGTGIEEGELGVEDEERGVEEGEELEEDVEDEGDEVGEEVGGEVGGEVGEEEGEEEGGGGDGEQEVEVEGGGDHEGEEEREEERDHFDAGAQAVCAPEKYQGRYPVLFHGSDHSVRDRNALMNDMVRVHSIFEF